MASLLPTRSQDVDFLENLTTCTLCNDQKETSLHLLPCFHSFCRHCLEKYLANTNFGEKACCPECKDEFTVPIGGVAGFPENFFSNRMKAIASIHSKNPPLCKVCEQVQETSQSSHFCIQCRHHLCDSDAKRHKATPGHHVLSYNEIQQEENMSRIISSHVAICKEHSTDLQPQPLKYFCVACKCLVCQECIIMIHGGHQKITTKEASVVYYRDLNQKLEEIHKIEQEKRDDIDGLLSTLNFVRMSSKARVADFDEWGKGVKDIVDKIVQDNITTVLHEASKEDKKLESILAEQNNQLKRLTEGRAYTKAFLSHGTDQDVLQNYKMLQKKLENAIIKQDKPNSPQTSEDLVVHANIEEVEKSLKKLFFARELSNVTPIAKWQAGTGASIGLTLGGDESVIVVKRNTATIFSMDGTEKSSFILNNMVDARNVVTYNNELYVSDCYKDKRCVSVYDLQGQMKRMISLPSREKGVEGWVLGLAIDSFLGDLYISSVYTHQIYKCLATQNSAQPFITSGLSIPQNIWVTPKRGLLVSNKGSNTVSMYDNGGTLVWKYNANQEELIYKPLGEPLGVCTDSSGHIFIADNKNRRIQCLSPEGNFLRFVHTGEDIEFPSGMAMKKYFLVSSTSGGNVIVIKCNYK